MTGAALAAAKAAAREQALVLRAELADPGRAAAAQARLAAVLAEASEAVVAAYLPIGSEIDSVPALAAHRGALCLPVVVARAAPLVFRRWRPGDALEPGPLGTRHPPTVAGELRPEVLVVPLLAFDAAGRRLGYGGGFYDRTLAALREAGTTVRAIGFAYAGQRMDDLPTGPHDAPLDLIVTEDGAFAPAG